MTFPFVLAFLLLLGAYMVYSEWARLDSRYLIGGALALLVATALVDAAGSTDLANTLAEFVFFLLAGGVLLLLVDHLRGESHEGDGSPRSSGSSPRYAHPPDPPQQAQRAPDQPFERSE